MTSLPATPVPQPIISADRLVPHPAPFLDVRVHDMAAQLSALCAGYEQGEWRGSQLAKHLMEWLPDFALSAEERVVFNHANGLELLRKAALQVYQTDKYKRRGEFGELLLHVALRQAA